MYSRKLYICVDLDGIVTDLHTKWLDLYNADYGDNASLDDLRHWDMAQNVKGGTEVFKYLNTPNLFLDLNPLPGAIEGLKELCGMGHELQVLTTTMHAEGAADKFRWCKRHLPFIPARNVTISSTKHRFLTDVIIDDSPGNIREHAATQPDALRIGIAWPYNAEVATLMHLRAESYRDTAKAWENIVDYICAISLGKDPVEKV